ncbi:spoU rRNA methylase family protein [Chlamydia trachomatis]|nr:spoU rRNA methylase family protein [Chlamydia trachomatis]
MLANPHAERVKKVAALAGRSARRKTNLLLVEGPQAVRELLAFSGQHVRDVYFTEGAANLHPDVHALASCMTRWCHTVTDEVASAMSPDAQGVIAVATRDALMSKLPDGAPRQTYVVLAQGRDPGNVGTIIRTADAMGCAGVIVVAGTVNIASPKVIRSSAGSVFHLPLVGVASFDEATQLLKARGVRLLGTSGGVGIEDLGQAMTQAIAGGAGPLASSHAWVFGNEAKGMSQAELDACDTLVRIDMTGQTESLNVASAASMCLFASQCARLSN